MFVSELGMHEEESIDKEVASSSVSDTTPNPPDTVTKGTAGEPEENDSSDELNGKSDTNLEESNSSCIRKTNESDHSDEDKQLPTNPEQNGSETSKDEEPSESERGESHTGGDHQQAKGEVDNLGNNQEKDQIFIQQPPSGFKHSNQINSHSVEGPVDTDNTVKEEDDKLESDSDESL